MIAFKLNWRLKHEYVPIFDVKCLFFLSQCNNQFLGFDDIKFFIMYLDISMMLNKIFIQWFWVDVTTKAPVFYLKLYVNSNFFESSFLFFSIGCDLTVVFTWSPPVRTVNGMCPRHARWFHLVIFMLTLQSLQVPSCITTMF